MIIYSLVLVKLALGLLCLILQINLLGKGNLAPGSASGARAPGGAAGILTPYVPTAGAPVTAQSHLQHGRPATRTARAPASGSHCHATRLHSRTGDTTTGRDQRHGKPAPHGRVRAAAP